MTGPVVLDEFHVTLSVPAGLTDEQVRAARRILGRRAFRARLARTVRRLLDRHAALGVVTAQVSR